MTQLFTRLLEEFSVLELAAPAAELRYHPGCSRRGLLALPLYLKP